VGERFGPGATHAGHVRLGVEQAITGSSGGPIEDDDIDALNALAGWVVYARQTVVGFGWTHTGRWTRYQ
jgi:hypothetical protein